MNKMLFIDDTEHLIKLNKELGVSDIALYLQSQGFKITKQAVSLRFKAVGYKPIRHRKGKVDEMITLSKLGKPLGEIAEKQGICTWTAWQRFKEADHNHKPQRFMQKIAIFNEAETIAQLRQFGGNMTQADMAKKLNVAQKTISKWAKKVKGERSNQTETER